MNDILDHAVLGPAIRKGLQQGLEQGLQQGLAQGRREGKEEGLEQGRREVLMRLLERRFGRIPDSARARIANLSAIQLDEAAIRILDISSLEELFPSA